MHFSKSIAAVVVTYFPPADLLENIRSYASFVDVVYVFDNSSPAAHLNLVHSLGNVQVISNNDNLGIATNLNSAAQRAIREGFQWLLTMDQDSRFGTGVFEKYLNCVHAYHQKDQVAQFCPTFETDVLISTPECMPQQVRSAITSGCLLNLQHFQFVGGFDGQLFIDLVDYDYCVRARAKGLQLIMFRNIFLEHDLGKTVTRASIKTLYLKKKTKRLHTPLRWYYIYRNLLYLTKKLKPLDAEAVAHMWRTMKGPLYANFFYGRFAISMLRYLVKARKDFAAGRMGRIRETKQY